MAKTKTRVFDAAEYLDSPEMIAEYLTEALETDDEAFIAKAIGTVRVRRGWVRLQRPLASRGKTSTAH